MVLYTQLYTTWSHAFSAKIGFKKFVSDPEILVLEFTSPNQTFEFVVKRFMIYLDHSLVSEIPTVIGNDEWQTVLQRAWLSWAIAHSLLFQFPNITNTVPFCQNPPQIILNSTQTTVTRAEAKHSSHLEPTSITPPHPTHTHFSATSGHAWKLKFCKDTHYTNWAHFWSLFFN